MTGRHRTILTVTALLAVTLLLSGCGLWRKNPPAGAFPPPQANPGEQQGTIPAGQPSSAAVNPASTPDTAILRFGEFYINWSYRNIAAHERQLAASAVGDARLAESQAAASAERDLDLRQGDIFNRGTVVSVAAAIGGAAEEYTVVTREETGGNPEYAGLQAAFHVTLATVQKLHAGWAVSEWLPQS
jgi:hypothetical protein